jgi:hypothetical protein
MGRTCRSKKIGVIGEAGVRPAKLALVPSHMMVFEHLNSVFRRRIVLKNFGIYIYI